MIFSYEWFMRGLLRLTQLFFSSKNMAASCIHTSHYLDGINSSIQYIIFDLDKFPILTEYAS